jgi:hypothetical protein
MTPNAVTAKKNIELINKPIWSAFLYAFHEEYSQNGWEIRINIKPQAGNFKAMASWPPIVSKGMNIWDKISKTFLFMKILCLGLS